MIKEFKVRESAKLNYALAVMFFVMFVFAMIFPHQITGGDKLVNCLPFLLFLLGAIYFVYAAKKKDLLFLINEEGIYFKSKHICNWTNFKSAWGGRKEIPSTVIDDQAIIHVRYYKQDQLLEEKFAVSDTSDKNYKEIIYAINEIYLSYRKETKS